MLFKFKIIGILHFLVDTLMLKCKIAGSAALGCGAPKRNMPEYRHPGKKCQLLECKTTGKRMIFSYFQSACFLMLFSVPAGMSLSGCLTVTKLNELSHYLHNHL
jgi:hypothetical protein